jgi:alkylhydroperoxidase family enzyme
VQGEKAAVAQQLGRGELDQAEVPPKEKALLELCGLLTEAPYKMTAEAIERVRSAGWSDNQIGEAVYVTAMFAMFNRIADAFGLEDPDYPGSMAK